MTCPECNPEPATAPVVRCRKCGRSECRHDASHHAAQSYDMHTRTECMTCVKTEIARTYKPVPVPPGYAPVPGGLIERIETANLNSSLPPADLSTGASEN